MFDALLDSLCNGFDTWAPSFGIGRRGRKLLESGEAATATIVGIRVTRTSDSDDGGTNNQHYAYALDVRTGTGARRLACRQRLTPQRELTHLGSQVQVRHRKDRVIIDWAATLEQLGQDGSLGDSVEWWKPLNPRKVAEGVEDHEQNGARKRIAKGTPATATVLRVNELTSNLFGGTLENVDVDVQLRFATDATRREGLLRKIIPPDYAAYLLTVGTVLPVGLDQDGKRITVDWVAAVNGGASFDASPPPPTRDPAAPLEPTKSDQLGGMLGGLIGKALDAGGVSSEAPEGMEIPFETYVEVSARLAREAVPPEQHDAYAQQFGVPAGAWQPGSAAWQSRMARDWSLGARYGEAYQAAYQRLGG